MFLWARCAALASLSLLTGASARLKGEEDAGKQASLHAHFALTHVLALTQDGQDAVLSQNEELLQALASLCRVTGELDLAQRRKPWALDAFQKGGKLIEQLAIIAPHHPNLQSEREFFSREAAALE